MMWAVATEGRAHVTGSRLSRSRLVWAVPTGKETQ
jgi:hypothetical protein